MFRWESPGGAQTHESAAGTHRTMNPALRNIWPGWFHTHINLWGPSKLPASVVPPQHNLLSCRAWGSPYPEQWGPASIGAQIIWVCLPSGWRFHEDLPPFGSGSSLASWVGGLHLKPWSRKQIHQDPRDYYRERCWGKFENCSINCGRKHFHKTYFVYALTWNNLKPTCNACNKQHFTCCIFLNQQMLQGKNWTFIIAVSVWEAALEAEIIPIIPLVNWKLSRCLSVYDVII